MLVGKLLLYELVQQLPNVGPLRVCDEGLTCRDLLNHRLDIGAAERFGV